ncbi:MAG: sigma-70 family RNA polymerase sigma factor [Chloroflexi bacterium]|nr:sigma-70 family RNA polymerase sigma factor [Chloroflexota bacterium]
MLTVEDAGIIQGLRRGDESVFVSLFNQYQNSLLRLALIYATDQRIAEEVVQETWLAVLKGIHRFEGRSALKTWIYSILINRAKTVAQREGRHSDLALSLDEQADLDESTVAVDRFRPDEDPQYPHHWLSGPQDWGELPEEKLLSDETRRVIFMAIEGLSPNQREVITLRDIEMLSSEEACNILGISESNQRVLLHRARGRVRQALEQYFGE